MPDPKGIRVARNIEIPLREIRVRTSRSSGPGGQHVNKVETQVELRWDVENSEALSDVQKKRVVTELGHRLIGGHVLRIRSSAGRSQTANRRVAQERLGDLVREALRPRPKRRPTRPTKSSQQARLQSKRRRAETKARRARPIQDD